MIKGHKFSLCKSKGQNKNNPLNRTTILESEKNKKYIRKTSSHKGNVRYLTYIKNTLRIIHLHYFRFFAKFLFFLHEILFFQLRLSNWKICVKNYCRKSRIRNITKFRKKLNSRKKLNTLRCSYRHLFLKYMTWLLQ